MDNLFYKQIEQFPKELKLLLSLMEKKVDESKLCNDFFKDVNWDFFFQLCIHHRVFPIIYLKIKELDSKYIPSTITHALFREYQKNIFRMLHFSGETEILTKLFEGNNIRTLFLKGPILATDLYGDLSLRTCADLDILIPFDNLKLAEEILIDQGYIKDEYIQTVLNDWKWRHHHFTFFHPQKKIKVEIHWRLNPGPAKEPSFEQLWKRKRVSKLTNSTVYSLGLEDLFVFLVSHGARHGWSRLRWLIDIVRITELGIKWDVIIRLLKRYQLHHVAGQALLLTSKLLNNEVPNEMKNIITRKRTKQLAFNALFYIRQMVNLHTEPVPKEISLYHKKHLFSLMSNRQKFIFILSLLYPYPEDAEFFPLPRRLHFLYFPLRPVISILRKTRNRTVTRRA